ncbi:MAG: glycosyltransferase family 39 protein [Chloroflexota bacterium]
MKLLSPRLRWTAELLLVLGVLAAGLLVFFSAKAKIDSDEGNWIGTTAYFETFFIRRDFSPEAWPDSYWARTQPMVFRYVIGSWLWLRGHNLQIQNPNYDYSKPAAANRRLGLAPADDVLDDARKPARLMAALGAVTLYLVVRVLVGSVGGVVGGLAAATSFIGSPYLEENLIRAKAESTLMFFLLAALLLAILSVRRPRTTVSSVRWGLATGFLLGLAFGVKLTVVLALIAVTLWAVGACLAVWAARAGAPSWLRRLTAPFAPIQPGAAAPWVWPLVVLATVSFVFIITNPFLWPSPIARSWLLFENRRDEMAQQQLDVPSRAVYGLDRRATLVWERSVFNDAFSPSRLGPPLEAILTVAGALWLAARVLVARASGQRRAEMMVLLWLLCLWAGVTAGFGFLLQHYFVPTASIAILASGLAIGWAVQAAWNLAASLWQRSPSTPLPGERGQSGATPLLRA